MTELGPLMLQIQNPKINIVCFRHIAISLSKFSEISINWIQEKIDQWNFEKEILDQELQLWEQERLDLWRERCYLDERWNSLSNEENSFIDKTWNTRVKIWEHDWNMWYTKTKKWIELRQTWIHKREEWIGRYEAWQNWIQEYKKPSKFHESYFPN